MNNKEKLLLVTKIKKSVDDVLKNVSSWDEETDRKHGIVEAYVNMSSYLAGVQLGLKEKK